MQLVTNSCLHARLIVII